MIIHCLLQFKTMRIHFFIHLISIIYNRFKKKNLKGNYLKFLILLGHSILYF